MNREEPSELNDLQKFLLVSRMNESVCLDLCQLRRSGISDHCTSAAEVWPADAARAVVVIMGRPLEQVIKWMESGSENAGGKAGRRESGTKA